MKKYLISLAAAASLSLTLAACGTSPGGYTSSDWDMNNMSDYNNMTYCHNGIYHPLANNQYNCTINGTTSTPSIRPKPIVPPKTQQKSNTNSGTKAKSPAKQAPAPKIAPAPRAKSGK